MEFSAFFKRAFLQWQLDQGEPKTMVQFAEWLGVNQQNASNWMRGAFKPRKLEDISNLADKLGYEVYDILGLKRPMPAELDEPIAKMAELVRKFPPEFRQLVAEAISETALQVVKEGITEDDHAMAKRLVENIQRNIKKTESD